MKKILLLLTPLISYVSLAQYQANVKVTKQEQTQWCWAANSKCILDYYGKITPQCNIAEYTRKLDSNFGTSPCCNSPKGKCNNPNYLTGNSGIQGILKNFGSISSVSSGGALSVGKIQAELGAKRPFVIFISWNGGGGHFVVGCNYSSGTLTFMDPWQNNGMTTYKYSGSNNSIQTTTGSGRWNETLVLTTPFTTTGISNSTMLDEQVSIYPNPSEGSLTITSNHMIETINIYSTTGQLVSNFSTPGNRSYSFKIPASGFYNVQIITDEGSTYKKIIVK